MNKPNHVEGFLPTLTWMGRQAWRDLKSVYFANTPVWRWLKSGALLFLGFCVWATCAVLLSVRPEWTFLYLPMAYGFLLIVWGPLTHYLIVPLVLRLRRESQDRRILAIARNAGKINLTIFFALVIVLAVLQPGIMMLEFSPGPGEPTTEVRGQVECVGPDDGLITCEVDEPAGFDHAVVIADGEVLARADDEPYRMTFAEADLPNSRFLVEFRAADGSRLRTISQSV